jgi:hypothetical protein
VSPRAGADVFEEEKNLLLLTGIELRMSSSKVSQYTDYAIPAAKAKQ